MVVNAEPGFETVMELLETRQNFLSTVNLEEILTKCVDCKREIQWVNELINKLEISVIPFDKKSAIDSANFRQTTKSKGLSLGDRACLATAKILQATAITADKVWCQLDLDIKIKCIR